MKIESISLSTQPKICYVYKCEICGKEIHIEVPDESYRAEPRHICDDCRNKLRKLLNIEEDK